MSTWDPTKEEIFASHSLWGQYVDPNGFVTEEEFDAMTEADKEQVWSDCGFDEMYDSAEESTISAAAAALGRKGGSVKSERKAASSAANGAKGGRPAGNKLHAVTVRECTVEGLEQTVRVYAANADDAFARGVHKLYGKATWFKQDSGLLPGYGQIFKPAPECGPMAHRAVTMRVQITVEEVSQSGIAPRMTDLVDIPEPVAVRLRELIVGGTPQHRSRVMHLARNEVRRVLLGHSVSNKRRKLPGGLTMQQIVRTLRAEGLL